MNLKPPTSSEDLLLLTQSQLPWLTTTEGFEIRLCHNHAATHFAEWTYQCEFSKRGVLIEVAWSRCTRESFCTVTRRDSKKPLHIHEKGFGDAYHAPVGQNDADALSIDFLVYLLFQINNYKDELFSDDISKYEHDDIGKST